MGCPADPKVEVMTMSTGMELAHCNKTEENDFQQASGVSAVL